jgi:uncharacterized protein DUF5985
MAEVIYLLCALTSAACAWLLVRSYRSRGTSLLLWSSICFVGLALNNAVLFIDLVVVPSVDLSLVRALIGFLSVAALLVGLIWGGSKR